MESSIAMSYRFRAIITQKDDEARDFTRKISDHVNIIEQKLTHAKNDLEASAKRGGGMDGIWHNNRFRERLEKSRDDGMNFLNKAITALNSYTK